MYMTPFERYKHENKDVEIDTFKEPETSKVRNKAPTLPWASQVLAAKGEYRSANESPLKEWWIEQQRQKGRWIEYKKVAPRTIKKKGEYER